MRISRRLVPVSTSFLSISALALTGCAPKFCTQAAAVPSVSLDTTAVSIPEPGQVEVCLDEQCVPLGDGPGPSDAHTFVFVEGDESERILVVRTVDGFNLAGPTAISIPTSYPNGKDCGGEALQGSYRVSDTGEIELVR